MVTLSEKEKKKVLIIQKVISKNLSRKEASLELGVSLRQIDRLKTIYIEQGENGFYHKNRGKINNNKIQNNKKEEIVNLYLSEYFDYNFTHFYEEVGDRLNVSFIAMCNILNEHDIISPEAQHKTVKLYNEKMRKAIKENQASKEQIDIYNKRIELEKEKHVRRSSLLYKFGQEVQMDAALFIWFGSIPTMLHLAVDKATKKVLYGWFDYQETSYAYYVLLMNIVLKYGIPETIRTDKRGCFNVNNTKYSKSNLNITQFGHMCKELRIHLYCSSDPLFKPNVERENKTFKGRLKAELRHKNIIELEEANRYLNEVFIPKMNENFSYNIEKDKNNMRENSYTKEELNIIISERYKRQIDNASAIKFSTDYYIPISIETGEVVSYSKNTECLVIIGYDGKYYCKINDILYLLLKIEKREKKVYVKKDKSEYKYKGHIPSKDHPWRKCKKSWT